LSAVPGADPRDADQAPHAGTFHRAQQISRSFGKHADADPRRVDPDREAHRILARHGAGNRIRIEDVALDHFERARRRR
jgi:hypothetical protein